MSRQYREVTDAIEVPKEVGTTGLLRVVEEAVKRRRVVELVISAHRHPITVRVKRYVAEGEPDSPFAVDLSSLTPYAVLRNGEVREVCVEADVAAPVAILSLFREVSLAGLWPIAFVAGKSSHFWHWHDATAGVSPSQSQEDAYGLPFLTDRQVEDDTLLVAAAFDRNAVLVDVQRAYKLLIPQSVRPA